MEIISNIVALDIFGGIFNWSIATLLPTLIIYMVLVVALNIQWGYGGIFNFGVVAFFMVGAYTTAVLIGPPAGEFKDYIYLFQGLLPSDLSPGTKDVIIQLLIPVSWLLGGLMAAVLGFLVAIPILRLREDYLAIVTIGIAEVLRTIVRSTQGLVNQEAGIGGIPRFLTESISSVRWSEVVTVVVLLVALGLVIFAIWAFMTSPFGRAIRSVRDDEHTAESIGKKVSSYRLKSFVLGATFMGFAGGLYATTFRAATLSAFSDLSFTFLVWAMLIVGGSGRTMGALLGALLVGTLWFGADLSRTLLPFDIPAELFAGIRQIAIGVLIVVFVIYRPLGILPEQAKISRFIPSLKKAKLKL